MTRESDTNPMKEAAKFIAFAAMVTATSAGLTATGATILGQHYNYDALTDNHCKLALEIGAVAMALTVLPSYAQYHYTRSKFSQEAISEGIGKADDDVEAGSKILNNMCASSAKSCLAGTAVNGLYFAWLYAAVYMLHGEDNTTEIFTKALLSGMVGGATILGPVGCVISCCMGGIFSYKMAEAQQTGAGHEHERAPLVPQ
ncbi:MAG: hypothetical protein K0U29_04110 [Gammaproteobacteria bacterium]|nr:hypothetical protein [Gammaproteobacteria bacterium]MCH9744099.1 hypothetical protein [Gammaproteobacteria bacterium]